MLLQEQRQLAECSKANKSLHEQSGRMYTEMHGLATTNLSLREDLESAYKTVEASQKRNIELEHMLEKIPGQTHSDTGIIASLEAKAMDQEKADSTEYTSAPEEKLANDKEQGYRVKQQGRKLRPRNPAMKIECD